MEVTNKILGGLIIVLALLLAKYALEANYSKYKFYKWRDFYAAILLLIFGILLLTGLINLPSVLNL